MSFYTEVICKSPLFHSTLQVNSLDLLEPVTRAAVISILHDADTLAHLLETNSSIIAGVFTAVWGNPDATPLPNVWQSGQNEMNDGFRIAIPFAKAHIRVGGLGACTLIHREVWERGVTYDEVYNRPTNYRGEDRDFCMRAVCAGFDLMACAHKKIEHRERPKIEREAVCNLKA